MMLTFNHLKTFYNALKEKIKKSRGNWLQNDPTADDYIRNRPFYEEVVDSVVLPETTIDVETAYSDIYNPFKLKLEDGKLYIVIFDGVTYKSVAKSTYDNEPFIGNSSILGWNDNIDTGEPFFIDVWDDEEVTFATTTSGKHTITILCHNEVIHKLDKKFLDLPDNLITADELADVAKTGSYNDLSDIPTDVVLFSSQTLTDAQKAQARLNIGASNFSGSYNDLTNKPSIPSVDDIVDSLFTDGSIGLKYTLYDDYAELYSYGECVDTDIKIASVVKGLPVTSIGKNAFYGNKKITSVIIPDSVTQIGTNTFYNCPNLTNVTIGKGVTSISETMFYKCTSLASITIPGSVTSIGTHAFADCTSLANLTIEHGVTSIASGAFLNCSNLAIITMTNSVTSLGDNAFSGCKVTDIYYAGTSEELYAIFRTTGNLVVADRATKHYI